MRHAQYSEVFTPKRTPFMMTMNLDVVLSTCGYCHPLNLLYSPHGVCHARTLSFFEVILSFIMYRRKLTPAEQEARRVKNR
ncbi:hypothetical protein L917_07214, partial [Phytophthora nicotianae]